MGIICLSLAIILKNHFWVNIMKNEIKSETTLDMKSSLDDDLFLELGLPSDPKNQFKIKITNWAKEGPKDLVISDNQGEICSIKNLAHLRNMGEVLFKVKEDTEKALEGITNFIRGKI